MDETPTNEPEVAPAGETFDLPSIGRIVHYRPNEASLAHPAIVCHLHGTDGMVNLAYWDANGGQHARTSVPHQSMAGLGAGWSWPPRV